MDSPLPHKIAKERVIEGYKRTRRIATAAREARVPESTARRWLVDAGMVVPDINDRSSLGEAGRNVVKGPDSRNLHRVDRDPCPKCNTRKDIGCKHFPKQPDPAPAPTDRERAEAMWSAKP